MDVSPTARVPSTIERIITPDLPRAGTLNNATAKRIILKRPAGFSSEMEVMKGLAGGRSLDIPPAPRALSTEEKTELLKSAGVTFKELPNSYVTLPAKNPQLEGRGALEFIPPNFVDALLAGSRRTAMPLGGILHAEGDLLMLIQLVKDIDQG